MTTSPPSDPEPNHHADTDDRIDTSLRYHTRQALSAVVEHVETMNHAVTAVDNAMAEVFADDEPDKLRQAVVAARAGLLQVGASFLEVERSLGVLEGLASAVDILAAERPTS